MGRGKWSNLPLTGILVVAGWVCANSDTVGGEGNSVTASASPGAPAAGREPGFRHAPPTAEELERLLKSGYATTVRVDRVLVPVVVTDGKGKPVLGLKKDDFQISENQIPQKIDYFDMSRSEPVSIAFLLDVSGSMRLMDKIGEAREAVRFFLSNLRDNDRASLITFADGEVDPVAPMGTRPDILMAHLLAVKAYGQTALNDAIAAAPGAISDDDPGRKAIILVTDGIDNASRLSLPEATSAASRTDVPIYTIGFSTSSLPQGTGEPEAGSNAAVLKRISVDTGGRYYSIEDPDDLKEAILSIEGELRTQYVLGYTPPNARCDGTFRKIDLKVAKDRYHVRTRKGYVAGPC